MNIFVEIGFIKWLYLVKVKQHFEYFKLTFRKKPTENER